MQIVKIMLAQLPNNSYLCKCKDSSGVATLRKGQTDSLSLLSFVGIIHNVGSMKEQEIWKPVVGFDGYYEVSNLGRVRSVERTIEYADGRVYTYRCRVLSPTVDKYGYCTVQLSVNRKIKRRRVHNLVAEAFISNPEKKPYIDHIDTNPSNNHYKNLRWATQKDNMNNPLTKSRIKTSMKMGGALKCIATKKAEGKFIKKVYQYSLDGLLIAEYDSITDAHKATNISKTGICMCCSPRYKINSICGYIWSFNKIVKI